MAVLSTVRNVYVNITLSNIIALFWLSPSNENGMSKSSGIFGKRICRVTKADILRDAQIMEDETRAEAQAQQASIQSETLPNKYPAASGKVVSPSSSSSSLPSSIRAPINNHYYGNRKEGSRNYQMCNTVSPIRPNFVPDITSSPSTVNRNTSWNPNYEARFRNSSPRWPQSVPYERVPKQSTDLPNFSGSLTPLNSKSINTHNGRILDSQPRNSTIQTNSFQSNFNFQQSLNTAACNQKENNISSGRNTNISKHISGSTGYNLLEGLDEDSLFGDF